MEKYSQIQKRVATHCRKSSENSIVRVRRSKSEKIPYKCKKSYKTISESLKI